VDYLVGLSGCCFIVGLALYPTPYERLHGASRALPLLLLAASLLLIGVAACT